MTVLHVYSPSCSMAESYVQMLRDTVGNSISMLHATTEADMKKLLKANPRPDIIHQHGSLRFSLPAACRLVITPHGEQVSDSTKEYVVIARSDMERQSLSAQFKRVETILNPIITRTTTPQVCARQLMRIYQRVVDSDVFPLMSWNTKDALFTLLLAAISEDRRWISRESVQVFNREINYRQLYIYARYEGIMHLVHQGFNILGIAAPTVEPTESYLPEGYAIPQPIKDKGIVPLLTDIQQKGPSMLRLAETAKALRNDCLNEEQLLNELDTQQLRGTLESVLQLLEENALITEGFMPCSPAETSNTKRLRNLLYTRQAV